MTTSTQNALAEAVQRRTSEITARRDALASEARSLLERTDDTGELTGPDRERFTAIEGELAGLRDRHRDLAALARSAGGGEQVDGAASGFTPPAGADRADRPGSLTGEARRSLDALHSRGLPDHAAERAETLLKVPDVDPSTDRGLVARWLTVAGSPAYERAFLTALRDPAGGFIELDEAERAAWREGRAVQRALGLGSDGGSYMVPTMIDPSIMLSGAGSNNPLRQVARVVTITTSAWHGVASSGATAEWKAEAAEVGDGTPELTGPEVPVYLGDSFVPFSFEWESDAESALSELQAVLTDAADMLQNAAYTTGTGVGQPSGLIPGATAADTAAAGAFAPGDIYGLQNALPPRFSAGASWLSSIAVANTVRQFETPNGALMFPEMRQAPAQLAGKPWRELSDMTADMTTAGSRFLAYGDYSRGMVIADRIGASLEIVPHLFGPNQRPTGQRGALLWFRTGSDVVLPEAIRVLTVQGA